MSPEPGGLLESSFFALLYQLNLYHRSGPVLFGCTSSFKTDDLSGESDVLGVWELVQVATCPVGGSLACVGLLSHTGVLLLLLLLL